MFLFRYNTTDVPFGANPYWKTKQTGIIHHILLLLILYMNYIILYDSILNKLSHNPKLLILLYTIHDSTQGQIFVEFSLEACRT